MDLYLYSSFLVLMTTQSSLQSSFTFTQSHTHSYSASISSTLLFCEAQFGVQYLAQGHFGMQILGRLGIELPTFSHSRLIESLVVEVRYSRRHPPHPHYPALPGWSWGVPGPHGMWSPSRYPRLGLSGKPPLEGPQEASLMDKIIHFGRLCLWSQSFGP